MKPPTCVCASVTSNQLSRHFVQAEGFIALPGGIGTMEELTEMMTWSGLNLHTKPIALLNTEGYYHHFLQWVSILSGDTR